MFRDQIFKLTKPCINPYKDDRDKFSKKFSLMTEDSSGFENLIKDMNNSQVSISKIKIVKCENPNCKSAFPKYDNCGSCFKVYCTSCLLKCENCNITGCKFCINTFYENNNDNIQICPGCTSDKQLQN